MKFLVRSIIIMAWITPALCFAEPEDWRLQLLDEVGMSLQEATEKFLKDGKTVGEKEFLELVRSLGSEDFAVREKTQRQIEALGATAIPLIGRLPETDDPEIALRLTRISSNLASHRRWTNEELLRYAVTSLSREKNGDLTPQNAPLVFAERFQDRAEPITRKYRQFEYVRDEGLTAKVTNGELQLSGEHGQEGDQRLILGCTEITGKETFPDEFSLEVSAKTTPGGEGIFHIGVSVGNVRVLFHPGYRGGGFRHERVDNNKELSQNRDMGFTPKVGVVSNIALSVKKLPDNQIELNTTIHQAGAAKPFESKVRIPAEDFGKIMTLSLDRSGNPGGTAIFHDLVIEIKPDT